MKFCKVLLIYIAATFIFSAFFTGCKKEINSNFSDKELINYYREQLKTQNLNSIQKYSIVKKMAMSLKNEHKYNDLILLLTEWVEKNPDDIYKAYWLSMTADAYLSLNAEPIAEYYLDRILSTCPDLYVDNKSIHLICLQNLIQISKTPSHRIKYFKELINRFPQNINTTELYLRLALEYEKDSQWDEALSTYSIFVKQPDATTIQIPGEPDAYRNARRMIDFNNSSKNWTFETLQGLENAVKRAINNYEPGTLDRYRAKVNFFAMSWKQDEMNADSQENFTMYNWMNGNTIRYSPTLDESSTSSEAYLRTWGWNDYVSIWYFYFRKIDFPLDPEINGNWEWAGIYIGNKL
ncbi:MAG: tetratricopeptide repeat protein [Treponema sp.]|nr:tetratricopeptide repeat protein [Treponema sp.]